MRKMLMIFLCFVIIACSASLIVSAETENALKIEIRDAKWFDGCLEYPVVITENPGIIALRLRIVYDNTELTLTEIRDSGNFGAAYHSDNMSADPCYLYWNNPTSKSNLEFEGQVATLVFRKTGNTNDSKVSLDCDFNNFDCINFELDAVRVQVQSAEVPEKEEIPDDDYSSTTTRQEAAKETQDGFSPLYLIPMASALLLSVASIALVLRKEK